MAHAITPYTGARTWTADMDAFLTGRWGLFPCAQIAQAMSEKFGHALSKNSIVSRAHRIRLPLLPNPIRDRAYGDRKKTADAKKAKREAMDQKRKERDEKYRQEIEWMKASDFKRVTTKAAASFLDPSCGGGLRCFCGKFALPGKNHCYCMDEVGAHV